ncbi:sensor histidine kinase [Parafilimonas sp.]|uniref:sensor histidine kinase n=1 Tax=Parafilimonas sp. TaxID=1969739 RepID=UPI003F7E5176
MALITTPVIALLVAVPLYTVRRENHFNFFVIWMVYVVLTIISWYLNIALLSRIKKRWINTWIRAVISSVIMIAFGTLLLQFSPFRNNLGYLSKTQLALVRSAYIFSINFIVFILLDLIFSKEKQIQLNKENAELKFANLDAEYMLLKEQVNPHFLYNALNVSKSLIKKQPAEAEKYIMQLSDFLRSSVNNQQKSASIASELELADKFIELQQLRFYNSIMFAVNIDSKMMDLHIPFFTIVSLLENAIKHNRFDEKNPLLINIYTEDDVLVVRNNLQPKFVLSTSRTGLANINQRSILLSGNGINIIQTEQEFLVKIKPAA